MHAHDYFVNLQMVTQVRLHYGCTSKTRIIARIFKTFRRIIYTVELFFARSAVFIKILVVFMHAGRLRDVYFFCLLGGGMEGSERLAVSVPKAGSSFVCFEQMMAYQQGTRRKKIQQTSMEIFFLSFFSCCCCRYSSCNGGSIEGFPHNSDSWYIHHGVIDVYQFIRVVVVCLLMCLVVCLLA